MKRMITLARASLYLRRTCLVTLVAMIATPAWPADEDPDTIYVNGVVLTMDSHDSVAQAVATAGSRIVAVGSERKVRELAKASTIVVDLAGRTMLPGFIDAHGHFPFGKVAPERAGELPSRWDALLLDVSSPPVGSINSIDEIVAALAARAATTPKGDWIRASGYDDTLLKDQRHPTRADLDRATTEHPVYLSHVSGHVAVANSAALAIGNVNADTQQPPGGHVYMDPDSGEPTGVLEEISAMSLVNKHAPPVTTAQTIEAAEVTGMAYATVGVTTAQMGAAAVDSIDAFVEAWQRGRLPVRVQVWPVIFEAAPLLKKTGSLPEIPPTDNFVSYGAIKGFADGSIQAYTGYLREPYHAHDRDDRDFRGYPTLTREMLVRMVGAVHDAGYQLAIHGNGDASIDDILHAYSEAQKATPREDSRHIVIHAQMAKPEQLKTMAELGVVASFFNLHTYYWGDRHRDIFLGPERAARISAASTAIDQGTRFTLHADSPVVPMDPIMMVWAAVNRLTSSGEPLGPDERITVLQALRAITIDAAWQGFEEELKGSIEAGKLADLIVLDADPLTAEPLAIRDIQVVRTIVGGKTIYERR